MTSGNTFRVRIDGSHVDQFSFGQVNPFGMTFDPRGDMFTADCHSRPGMLVLRGGCYSSFGKPHDGLGFAPEIMTHEHGSTGIAGIVYYTGGPLPAEYRDTIFLGNPVTGIINHDRITTHGSTHYGVELPDFMTCDDLWFRPVDLQLATDGSIYVADFYNCIIGHYEVPLTHPLRDKTRGRIWRISYVGKDGRTPQPKHGRPLASVGGDAGRFALQRRICPTRTFATHELVDRIGQPAIAAVRNASKPRTAPQPESTRSGCCSGWEPSTANWHARCVQRCRSARREFMRSRPLAKMPWGAWRAISGAETPRRCGSVRAAGGGRGARAASRPARTSTRWSSCGGPTDASDTMLIHVTRIALRNTVRGASGRQWDELRQRYQAAADTQTRLIDVCMGIHTPAAAGLALAFLTANPQRRRRLGRFAGLHRQHDRSRPPARGRSDGARVSRQGSRPRSAACSSRCSARAANGARPIPDELKNWADAVAHSLFEGHNARSASRAVSSLAEEAQLPSAVPVLVKILNTPRQQRFQPAAAEALVRIDATAALPAIEMAVRNPESPLKIRCSVVETLRQTNDPAEPGVSGRLAAGRPAAAGDVGRRHAGPQPRRGRRPDRGRRKGALRARNCWPTRPSGRGCKRWPGRSWQVALAKLLEGLPKIDERINQLIATRAAEFAKASPNAERGVAVFQKNCAACHQIAGKGNRVGPQLDGAGNRGVERLLEDVLDPNRNVDVDFRATILALDDGQVANGIIVREEGPVLVLVDSKGAEQRIAKSKIEQRTQTKLSPMPANVAEQLSPQELNDLLAYLLKQRKPGEANR